MMNNVSPISCYCNQRRIFQFRSNHFGLNSTALIEWGLFQALRNLFPFISRYSIRPYSLWVYGSPT
jgi:hypothetical protein